MYYNYPTCKLALALRLFACERAWFQYCTGTWSIACYGSINTKCITGELKWQSIQA